MKDTVAEITEQKNNDALCFHYINGKDSVILITFSAGGNVENHALTQWE